MWLVVTDLVAYQRLGCVCDMRLVVTNLVACQRLGCVCVTCGWLSQIWLPIKDWVVCEMTWLIVTDLDCLLRAVYDVTLPVKDWVVYDVRLPVKNRVVRCA